MSEQILEAVREAIEAGETSIQVERSERSADVIGNHTGLHCMIGYNVTIGADGNGTLIYDAPGAPQRHIG